MSATRTTGTKSLGEGEVVGHKEKPKKKRTDVGYKRPPKEAMWKKGQSGNPGGQAKQYWELVNLARAHTTEAVRTLAELMQTGKDEVRVRAAEALLNRGWGMPSQQVDVTTRKDMSGPELQLRVLEILTRNTALAESMRRIAEAKGGQALPAPEPETEDGT